MDMVAAQAAVQAEMDRAAKRAVPAEVATATDSPRTMQVGGDHYTAMPVQPFEYITANGIGFGEGCAIKYLSRWRSKGGVEDLRKARHFIDMLIDWETRKASAGGLA